MLMLFRILIITPTTSGKIIRVYNISKIIVPIITTTRIIILISKMLPNSNQLQAKGV